jgi:predicted metal-dependent hydrolase
MSDALRVGEIDIVVHRKAIKNMHLSVYPPTGEVRLSAPEATPDEALRMFALSRLGWLREARRTQRLQRREAEREYIERETHYVWGQRYLLRVEEVPAAPAVHRTPSRLVLQVRTGTTRDDRRDVVAGWYRDELRAAAGPLVEKWSLALGVVCTGLSVRQMKTRWGSCNAAAGTIRLNTELAKKPLECLEYVIVHELAHMRVSGHGVGFQQLMDGALPTWRNTRAALHRGMLSYATWAE